MLNHYGSLYSLLNAVYPEYPWNESKILKQKMSVPGTKEELLKWAENILEIKEPSDWYKVTKRVSKFAIPGILIIFSK